MKFTRKLASILLGLAALFCIGAVVGSHLPNISIYATIAAVCVALVIFGLWYFYGHEKYEEDDGAQQ